MISEAELLLRAKYIDNLNDKIKNLELNLTNFDSEGILFLTHKIKGSAGMYGFQSISDNADKLQNILNNSKDLKCSKFKDAFSQLILSMTVKA